MDWIVHNTSEHMVEYVEDTRRERAPSNKTPAPTISTSMSMRVVGISH